MISTISFEDVTINKKALVQIAHLFSEERGTCLLYSGGSYDTSHQSFLCLFPFEFIHLYQNKHEKYLGTKGISQISTEENPWEALRELIGPIVGSLPIPEWIGFLSYEMGAYSDLEKQLPRAHSLFPDAYFQKCGIVLQVDHQSEDKATAFIFREAESFLESHQKEWFYRLSKADSWRELLLELSRHELDFELPKNISLHSPAETIDSYVKKIQKAQEFIRSGDIYQVNLSQKFSFQGEVNAFSLFHRLNMLNPAPFAGYMNLKEFSIVSSSPERLLTKRGNFLETRPIKGTAPRGNTEEQDKANRHFLLNSPKEKAELLMITDLMRNDLGKVSQIGSVHTKRIWECEAYANVFHLHSIICSQALPEVHPSDLLRSCFPGGSITGCPKLSAMEIILELEGRPRGIYTGALGYFASNGDFDFNIAIRTVVVSKNLVRVYLGGGIVSDSDPYAEYRETMVKGESIFNALGLSNFMK